MNDAFFFKKKLVLHVLTFLVRKRTRTFLNNTNALRRDIYLLKDLSRFLFTPHKSFFFFFFFFGFSRLFLFFVT